MQHYDIYNRLINTSSTYFIDPTGIKIENNAISNLDYKLDHLWEIVNKLQHSTPEFVELSCKNCGGKIQQKYRDQIFKCPYCKTVYAIGYRQVNA